MNSLFSSSTSSTLSSIKSGDENENVMGNRLNDVLSTISSDQFEAMANQLLWSKNPNPNPNPDDDDNNRNMIMEEEEEKMTFVITLIARIARTKRELASLLLRCILTV